MVLIVGIVGISAIMLHNSLIPNKMYSNNGLNFTYPGDMKPNATFMYVTSPTSNEDTETFGNDKLVISIGHIYYPLDKDLKGFITLDLLKKAAWDSLDQNSAGTTTLANKDISKNGTTIYEEIYSSKDPIKNTEYKNMRLIIIKDLEDYISLIFQTKASDFESQQNVINKIIESITLT